MRQITNIEMANSKELYCIIFGDTIEIKQESNGKGFDIRIAGEEYDFAESKREANALAKDYIIDEDLIISGYGMHSGRKFWQLPQKLQNEVMAIACK